MAQGTDLLDYVWHYPFTETVDDELWLVLFLQLASQYPERLRYTAATDMIRNIVLPYMLFNKYLLRQALFYNFVTDAVSFHLCYNVFSCYKQ